MIYNVGIKHLIINTEKKVDKAKIDMRIKKDANHI